MDASLSLSMLFAPPNKPPSSENKQGTAGGKPVPNKASTVGLRGATGPQGSDSSGADGSDSQQQQMAQQQQQQQKQQQEQEQEQQKQLQWQRQQWQQVGAILGAPDSDMQSILKRPVGAEGGTVLGPADALHAYPSASSAGNQMDHNLIRPAGWEDPFCWDLYEFAKVCQTGLIKPIIRKCFFSRSRR